MLSTSIAPSFSVYLTIYLLLSASGESFTYRTPHPLPEVTSVGFEISSPSLLVAPQQSPPSIRCFPILPRRRLLRLLSSLFSLFIFDRFKIIHTHLIVRYFFIDLEHRLKSIKLAPKY